MKFSSMRAITGFILVSFIVFGRALLALAGGGGVSFIKPMDGDPVKDTVSIEGVYDGQDPKNHKAVCTVVPLDDNGQEDLNHAINADGVAMASPFKFSWNTTKSPNAKCRLKLSLYDDQNQPSNDPNQGFITVTVENERNKPVASISSHHHFDVLRGTVTLTAVAADDVGVEKVRFYRGGFQNPVLIGEVPFQPQPKFFMLKWDTSKIVLEKDVIMVQAVDKAGNLSDYQNDPNGWIHVTIDNASVDGASDRVAVQLISPVFAAPVKKTVKVSGAIWNPKVQGPVEGVEKIRFTAAGWQEEIPFDKNQNNYEAQWDTTQGTINGLYSVRMEAIADWGQLGIKALATTSTTVLVDNPPFNPEMLNTVNDPNFLDKLKMAVITAPANGETLSEKAPLKATIGQDLGADHAKFRYSCANGAGPIGGVLAGPGPDYQTEWETKQCGDGAATIQFSVYDPQDTELASADSVDVVVSHANAKGPGEEGMMAQPEPGNGGSEMQAKMDTLDTGLAGKLDALTQTGAVKMLAPRAAVNAGTDQAIMDLAKDEPFPRDFGEKTELLKSSGAADRLNGVNIDDLSVDAIPPQVRLSTPAPNFISREFFLDISGTATDNVGIDKVEFHAMKKPLGVLGGDDKPGGGLDLRDLKTFTGNAPLYEFSQNTRDFTNGDYEITMVAVDKAGNAARTSVTVTLLRQDQGNMPVDDFKGISLTKEKDDAPPDNDPPAIKVDEPREGQKVSGDNVTISAMVTDNVEVQRVLITAGMTLNQTLNQPNGPYTATWNTTLEKDGPAVIRVTGVDKSNNSDFKEINVTVENDLNPPSVHIDSPADGAKVSDDVTVIVSASDDKGLDNVQIYPNYQRGVFPGKSFPNAPFELTFNSKDIQNGQIPIVAVAVDKSGKESRHEIQVTVANP